MTYSKWNGWWIGALVFSGVLGFHAHAGIKRICLEAESAAVTPPMLVVEDTVPADAPNEQRASGEKYIEIAQGKGHPPKMTNGLAVLSFDVEEPGEYTLWCRVWWLDACGNSLRINLDQAPGFTFGEDGIYKRWHWVKAPPRLKQLKLKQGKHTLTLANREDGVRVDQILLFKGRRFVPVGIEKIGP